MAPFEFSISSLYLSRGIPRRRELEMLLDTGISKIEVALSSWFPKSPNVLSGKSHSEAYRQLSNIASSLCNGGMSVVGLHSIFFESTNLNVFAKCENTLNFLVSRIRYCNELGGRFIVIGSPFSRKTETNREASLANYCWLLDRALEQTRDTDVAILTEALPTCSVFSKVSDLMSLAHMFGSDRVGVHLDLNSMVASGEIGLFKAKSEIPLRHVHLNSKDFTPIATGQRKKELAQLAQLLTINKYDQVIGLEYVTSADSTPDFDLLRSSTDYLAGIMA